MVLTKDAVFDELARPIHPPLPDQTRPSPDTYDLHVEKRGKGVPLHIYDAMHKVAEATWETLYPPRDLPDLITGYGNPTFAYVTQAQTNHMVAFVVATTSSYSRMMIEYYGILKEHIPALHSLAQYLSAEGNTRGCAEIASRHSFLNLSSRKPPQVNGVPAQMGPVKKDLVEAQGLQDMTFHPRTDWKIVQNDLPHGYNHLLYNSQYRTPLSYEDLREAGPNRWQTLTAIHDERGMPRGFAVARKRSESDKLDIPAFAVDPHFTSALPALAQALCNEARSLNCSQIVVEPHLTIGVIEALQFKTILETLQTYQKGLPNPATIDRETLIKDIEAMPADSAFASAFKEMVLGIVRVPLDGALSTMSQLKRMTSRLVHVVSQIRSAAMRSGFNIHLPSVIYPASKVSPAKKSKCRKYDNKDFAPGFADYLDRLPATADFVGVHPKDGPGAVAVVTFPEPGKKKFMIHDVMPYNRKPLEKPDNTGAEFACSMLKSPELAQYLVGYPDPGEPVC